MTFRQRLRNAKAVAVCQRLGAEFLGVAPRQDRYPPLLTRRMDGLVPAATQQDMPVTLPGMDSRLESAPPRHLDSTIMVSQPQFLLFCDTHTTQPTTPLDSHAIHGRWHFVLDRLDRPQKLEATDAEPAIHPDRLALLSVVRGLEAIDEPSQVNLVTTSRYVSRGLKYGLATWRASAYQWEHFGVQRPVRNADLWQRVDRAMYYHGVNCRLLQALHSDAAHAPTHGMAEELDSRRPVHSVTDSLLGTIEHRDELAGGRVPEKRQIASEKRWPLRAVEQPLHAARQPSSWYGVVNWWEMAAAWFKWWRRRQPRPAIYGM